MGTATATNKRQGDVRSAPAEIMANLRAIGLRSLARMYSPPDKLFYFRLNRKGAEIVGEGLSHRYTAITLIGLASEGAEVARSIFQQHQMMDVCANIVSLSAKSNNLGDVALSCWAAKALGYVNPSTDAAWKRLREFKPESSAQPTVELAWTLAAMVIDSQRCPDTLRDAVATRLMEALNRRAGVNPHVVGTPAGRAHVACFADQVYPIHALSLYSQLSGRAEALHDAARCAEMICSAQGKAGQWWWHYDARTGKVLEGYPVYAIHQDAMAPMALFALRNAGGPDFTANINRGVSWMQSAPELKGGTLVDRTADIVWRKVARREPRKLSRYLQAAASRLHRNARVPGTDMLFPPLVVDHEDRPYHLGWMLYAIHLAGSTWTD